MKMQSAFNAILLIFTVPIIFASCEYERVAKVSVCDNLNINLSIDSLNSVLSVECGEPIGEISVASNDTISESLLYSINDGAFSPKNNFQSLGAGTYKIVAKLPSSECVSEPLVVNVNNENGLSLTIAEVENTNCGAQTGTIQVDQENGIPPIQYKLNNNAFQNSSEFTNLSAGTYSVTAIDDTGCEVTIPNIELTTNVSLAGDIRSIINTNCAVTGCHNGSQPPNFTDINNIIGNATRIRSNTSNGSMPPAGRQDLTQTEIDLIACWVADGALNN